MDRMLAGVSTRKFARVAEPVGSDVEATARTTTGTSPYLQRSKHRFCRLSVVVNCCDFFADW
jgi:hypothetical protein